MAKNPQLTPELRDGMVGVVAVGVSTYITNFTSELWPDYKARDAQSVIAEGIAEALALYEVETGKPVRHAIALTLLDDKAPK